MTTFETASLGPGATNRAKPPKQKEAYRQLLSRDIQRLRSKPSLTETEQMLLTRYTDALIKELKKARRTK
jgi:hypothetical protein